MKLGPPYTSAYTPNSRKPHHWRSKGLGKARPFGSVPQKRARTHEELRSPNDLPWCAEQCGTRLCHNSLVGSSTSQMSHMGFSIKVNGILRKCVTSGDLPALAELQKGEATRRHRRGSINSHNEHFIVGMNRVPWWLMVKHLRTLHGVRRKKKNHGTCMKLFVICDLLRGSKWPSGLSLGARDQEFADVTLPSTDESE